MITGKSIIIFYELRSFLYFLGTNSSPTQLRETVHTSKIKNIDEIGRDIRFLFEEQIDNKIVNEY